MDLHNKNIVITGASRGLGKELVKKLSQSKPNLVLIARGIEELELLQQEIREQTGKSPLIVRCDISNENDVKNLTDIIRDKYQHIDVLVNNAGIGIHRESEAIENNEMRKLFEVNFYGPYFLIKSILPLLKKSNSAYILNVGSHVSRVSFAFNSVYAATKHALNGFTRGLRLELRKYNIKVGIIHPGLIDTSFQYQDYKKTHHIPAFFISKPEKVALSCIRMMRKRQQSKYLSKHSFLLMKLKQLMSSMCII